MAAAWARKAVLKIEGFEADWKRSGKAAGFRRNQAMLDAGVDIVVAFKCHSRSAGTDDMVGRAKRAKVRGIVYTARQEVHE